MILTSHLDLELTASIITEAIQRLFDTSFPCVPGELVPGLFLDHVEIGMPALVRSDPIPLAFDVGPGVIEVPGYGVHLNVPMTLVFATEAAIRAGGLDSPTPVQTLGVVATFRLLGDAAQGAGMQLTFISHTAVTPLADAQAQQTIMFMLGALFVVQNRFIALPLDALAGLLGAIPPVRNVAVATDTAGTRIVVRIEIDAPGGLSNISWEAFLTNPPDHLGENAWAMVLSPRLLESGVEARLDGEFNDSNEVEIDEPTHADWIAWSPVPMLGFTASIELLDKCPAVAGMDIGADITGSIQIQAQNGQLVSTIHFEFDLIDSDVLLCGLVGGLFMTAAGAVFGPIGAAIGGGIGLIFNFLVVPVAAHLETPDEEQIPQPPNCSIVDQGDRHVTLECTDALPVIATPLLGQLAAATVLGGADGLQILGTRQPVPALTHELTLSPMPLEWAQRFSCTTKSVSNEVGGGVGLYGALDVCPPVLLDDPLHFFSAHLVTDPAMRVRIESHEALRPQYTDAGSYPCHLLIQTNRGVRFVDLGPLGPPPPTPDPAVLEAYWIQHCLQALRRTWSDRWHPEWVIDPPPERFPMHWWRVSVQGLEPGDRLELQVDARMHVAASAGASGHAGVDAVVDPLQGEVTIRRAASHRHAAIPQFDPQRHRLAVVQTLLLRSGSAALPATTIDLTVLRTTGGDLLVTASSDGLRVWRTGGALGLELAWEGAAAADGIVASGAMLVSHGLDGLRSWTMTSHGTLRSASRIAGNFSRVVISRGHVAALRDGELQLFEVRNLRQLDASRVPTALREHARAALTRRATVRSGETRARDIITQAETPARAFASDHWMIDSVRINRHTLARLEIGGRRLDIYDISRPVSLRTTVTRSRR